MNNGFSIFMFLFAGAILLYAALMALTKDYNMLPYRSQLSVKPKDPKRYMTQLAKAVALVAAPVAVSGLIGLWSGIAGLIMLIAGVSVCLWAATKIMKGVK